MEYLFGCDYEIPQWRQPTTVEIQKWLKDTGGVYTQEIYKFLKTQRDNFSNEKFLQTLPPKDCISYIHLTGDQQYWIICELNS